MANAGRVLILAKGAWSATTNYVQLDMVSHNSVAYLARQASVGVDPSTDVAMNYWMPFGSAAQIATTSTPGLVMPDGTTITITNTGLIKAVLGINDITEVTITSPTNGQVLKYNSTTQKWENGSLGTAAGKDFTTSISSGSGKLITSGAVYTANQTLTNKLEDEAVTRSKVGAHNLIPMSLAWIKEHNTSGTWSGDKYTRDNVEYTFNTDSNGKIISVLVNTIGTVSGQTSVTIALKDFGNSNLNAYESPTANGYTISGGDNVNSSLNIYYYGDTHSIRIIVNAGASISSKLIYPMIRLASDPNTEFEPYAMTNRELMDVDADINKKISCIDNQLVLLTSHTINSWGRYTAGFLVGFMNGQGNFIGALYGTTYKHIAGVNITNLLTITLSNNDVVLYVTNGTYSFSFTLIRGSVIT